MSGRGKRRRSRREGRQVVSGVSGVSGVTNIESRTLEDLQCAVCRGLLCRPAALPCGHRFCLECVISSGPACPLCRRRAGAWLRRAGAQSQLIDEELWEYIQRQYPTSLPLPPTPPLPPPRLSAPGEIQAEFQQQLHQLREQRQHEETKYQQQNDQLIRELQEQERVERESRNSYIKEDEKLARDLSMSLNGSMGSAVSSDTPAKDESKVFYDHLGKVNSSRKADAGKPRTLHTFFENSNGNASCSRGLSTAASPELISTAGKCGRFVKNFFNGKLWCTKAAVKALPPMESKEPEVWEPDASKSGQNCELHVLPGNIAETDNSSSYISTINKIHDGRKKEFHHVELESESEDSLASDLCYFKPIQPLTVTNRFHGKVIKSIPQKKSLNNPVMYEENLINNQKDINRAIEALEKLKCSSLNNPYSNSAFACLLRVPVSSIKFCETPPNIPPKASPKKRKSKVKNASEACSTNDISLECKDRDDSLTPNKNGLRRSGRKKVSRSCMKLNHNTSPSNTRVTRLKRSLSFNSINNSLLSSSGSQVVKLINGDINGISSDRFSGMKKCNGIIQNGLEKTGNGHVDHANGTGIVTNELKKKGAKSFTNDDVKKSAILENGCSYPIANLDPSILEEQKYIERMIQQEKKDYDLARKLQQQLSGKPIFTGYTVRTASKRQATITELLSTSKKMKI